MIRLSDRLKELRTSCEWSQQDLAQRLEVSKQAVSNWERDAAKPDINQLVRIAETFRVSTDYLLGMGNDAYFVHPQGAIQPSEFRAKHWDWVFQDSYDLFDVLQSDYRFTINKRILSPDELIVYIDLIKVTERALAKKDTELLMNNEDLISEVERLSELKGDTGPDGKVYFR